MTVCRLLFLLVGSGNTAAVLLAPWDGVRSVKYVADCETGGLVTYSDAQPGKYEREREKRGFLHRGRRFFFFSLACLLDLRLAILSAVVLLLLLLLLVR